MAGENGMSNTLLPKHHLRLALCLLFAGRMVAICQILDVRDLNVDDIRSLDRQRTAVILQGGILEEHGPHLPLYSDGWLNEYLTGQLVEAIVARPGWKVLVFPVIPLGSGGANEIGRKYSFPGTFAVRPATLRAVYMDLAAELGEQGFRWVFLMNGHGAPSHSRALFDACDFYREVYGHNMVHLLGLAPIAQWFQDAQRLWSEQARRENGFLVHGDMLETSWMLYLRPTAVRSTYAAAQSRTAPAMSDVVRLAGQPDWQGYFGAPRLATASHGARAVQDLARRITKLALEILDGADARSIARFTDAMKDLPEQVQVDEAAAAHDADLERKQRDWLRKRDR